jgi:hypothetical protein
MKKGRKEDNIFVLEGRGKEGRKEGRSGLEGRKAGVNLKEGRKEGRKEWVRRKEGRKEGVGAKEGKKEGRKEGKKEGPLFWKEEGCPELTPARALSSFRPKEERTGGATFAGAWDGEGRRGRRR